MILISKYVTPKGYLGITIFPFVFLKFKHLKKNKVLINHENIHLRQQVELFVILFYIIYVFEFLIRLIQHRNWYLAYRNISFEREAYANEKDLNYLKSRSLYSVVRYIKK